MRNITVAVDEATYRRARLKAAELDTSVSRLVRDYLTSLAGEESEFERLERLERELRQSVAAFDGSSRVGRDELHERNR